MEPRSGGNGLVCTSATIFHNLFYFYLSENTFFTKQCRHRSDCSTWGSLIWVHSFLFHHFRKMCTGIHHHSSFNLSSCILNNGSPPRKNKTSFLYFHFWSTTFYKIFKQNRPKLHYVYMPLYLHFYCSCFRLNPVVKFIPCICWHRWDLVLSPRTWSSFPVSWSSFSCILPHSAEHGSPAHYVSQLQG